MNNNIELKMKYYAPIILRISIAIVFLWFALSQFIAPIEWTGYLPDWTSRTFMPQTTFIMLNATFETIFGLMLLLGVFTRISAALLGLHLIAITIAVGYNSIGVRDLGLSIAALSIALNGSDGWSLMKNKL